MNYRPAGPVSVSLKDYQNQTHNLLERAKQLVQVGRQHPLHGNTVLSNQKQFFLRNNRKYQTLFAKLYNRTPKVLFFGFSLRKVGFTPKNQLIHKKQMASDRKTNFFPRKKMVLDWKTNLFLGKRWLWIGKPSS